MFTNSGPVLGAGPWRAGQVEGFEKFPDGAMVGSVTDRFFEVAALHPESTAISSPAGHWTFTELSERVRSLAAGIIEIDGADSRPVAVLANHDGPLVVSILAAIAAGKIVVVMDPTVSPEDHDHVMAESGASMVLADESNLELASTIAERNKVAAHLLDDVTGETRRLPRRVSTDPAMLAFTSGTSGLSKGGIINHGVILNVVRGAVNALGITEEDRMPMLFPVSLAVASYPMFIPLLCGGTLATLDVRGVGLAPIADFLVDERITLAYMAPTVVRFLVDAVDGYEFPDLRMIVLGGELVDSEVVELTRRLFAPDLMGNGFGTTETGVITLYIMDPSETFVGTVPSGYAVEEVEMSILDDSGEPVALNVPGEIVVSSPHVFAGYWGHDELNELVLEPDRLGREGWFTYRTGDLGRLDDDLALTVMGRVDTKVKIRGRFVVLGDVEASIRELDGIDDAAVVAIERGNVRELRAIVVTSASDGVVRNADGVDTTVSSVASVMDGPHLRAALLERHEAYRVPAQWEFVDELPRLPNGKLDRRALLTFPIHADTVETDKRDRTSLIDQNGETVNQPGLPADANESDEPASPAATTFAKIVDLKEDRIEHKLRDIWEGLLPVGMVSVDDDFTHLGGDSLLAAQMLVMVENQTGVRIPMGNLVQARTIRQLADVVRRVRSETGSTTASIVQEGDPTKHPILWFVHDLQGSAYRIRHLARELGRDRPVWSFESPLLAGEANRFSTLDTFAANYVSDLVKIQPEGPYWLAGYSFGGVCAYEMARQLERDGNEVSFVGIVDVGPKYRGPDWGNKRPPLRPWFGIRKPPEEGTPLGERMAYYRQMVSDSPAMAARHLMVRTGMHQFIDPLRFKADLRKHGRVRPEWRLWYAWNEHWKLAVQEWYRGNTYPGEVDLIWASDSASADASMGWEPLVGSLNIHRFEGDHIGALEPRGSRSLADVLRRVIDERVERQANQSE